MILLLCVLTAAARPSITVAPLEAKPGVAPATAELLTDAISTELRASGAFSRVTTFKDLEVAAFNERQKQLIDCDSDNCLAEIAGALNVDMIVTGSVGKLGGSFVLSVRLTAARTGRSLAQTTDRIVGDSEEVLLDRIAPVVAQLLNELRGGAARGLNAPEPAPATPAAQPGRAAPLRVPGLVAVGAGLVMAAALAIGALALAVVAGSVVTFSYVDGPPIPPGDLNTRVAVAGTSGFGAAVLVVGALLGLALAAGGAALAVRG